MADFYPVALRVDEVEPVLAIVLQLAARDGVQVERQAALFERLLVLGQRRGEAAWRMR
jgi:hypothetical protein